MNLSTIFSVSHALNQIVSDYVISIPKIDDAHPAYKVVAHEVCVRVMAAFFTVIDAANSLINSAQDLIELNMGVGFSRGALSFAMLKVNVIYFKILVVGALSLAGAIIEPHYVHSNLKVLDFMRHDYCRLLTELPEDLDSLASSIGIELPTIEPAASPFEDWREQLAHHLEASLPDAADPLLDSSMEPASFINFHPALYRTALTDLLTDIRQKAELAEEVESTDTDPQLVQNWVDSHIEENPDYKKLLRLYAKEHKRVPTDNNTQLKVLALARLERAFGVQGTLDVRKKMRALYLLLHPDKTLGFTEKRKMQLTELFTFANHFAKYALD